MSSGEGSRCLGWMGHAIPADRDLSEEACTAQPERCTGRQTRLRACRTVIFQAFGDCRESQHLTTRGRLIELPRK